MIPIYKPYLTKEILYYAHEAIDSTWISSKGKYISLVEGILSKLYTHSEFKVNSALVCNNGTAACHLMAKTLKKAYPNIKKIIAPNNVYVAAWNTFLYDRDFEIITIDANQETWNFNKEILYDTLFKQNINEVAVLAVHNIMNIINVPKIQRDWPGLVVVEDNCEGLFGKYEGANTGSSSFASAISFFGNKTITSGEGGALIVPEVFRDFNYRCRGQGQSEEKFIHDQIGYNYRMTNIQAAILYGQLQYKDEIISKKKNIFNKYLKELLAINGISVQKTDDDTTCSNWMFAIRIRNSKGFSHIENFMKKNYIEVRPMFYPINTHNHLKHITSIGGTEVASLLNKECVILPSFPDMQDHEIAHVINSIKTYMYKEYQ